MISKLLIIAHDSESPEVMMIEIPEDKTLVLKDIFNGDYKALANRLNIVDKRLMIMAPQ